jgi:hypothetical protein
MSGRAKDSDTLGAVLADIATPLVRPLAQGRGFSEEEELRAIVRDEIDLAFGADAVDDAGNYRIPDEQ